jgi:isopenicillin-N epimerase
LKEAMRQHFLLDPSVAFLNHGSYGACPRDVFEDYQKWQLELERNPVDFLGRNSAQLLKTARQILATHVGAQVDDLVFISNATTGVNIVAKSLKINPGDSVVATDHEYGACELTWQELCRERGAHFIKAEVPLPYDSERFVDHIWEKVTPETRILFVSHVTSTTALRFPVENLCKRARDAGIVTVIDGAHAPGHFDLNLDALGADFYLGNCHKWLLAPKGSAFLHCRSEAQKKLRGLVTSWGYDEHVDVHDRYTGSSMLERRHQWQGTRDLAAFLAVPAAIAFRQKHNWSERTKLAQKLLRQAVEQIVRLSNIRNEMLPCASDQVLHEGLQMYAVPIPEKGAATLTQWLFEHHRIEAPVTRHHNRWFLRLSVQPYNSQADIERLIDALREFAKA